MTTENRLRYEYFSKEKNIPVFFSPWWLDIVCNKGSWEVCFSENKSGKIVGVLPFYLKSFLWLKSVHTPPFTPYLGVWLDYAQCSKKLSKRYAFENEAIGSLVEQLPKAAWYHQIHPIQLQNWFPFYWKGFRQTTRYTYIFREIDLESIFENMREDVKNKLRKAERLGLYIIEENNLEKYLTIQEKTFSRQNLAMANRSDIFKKLHDAIQQNGQGAIYFAEDEKGKTHATLYMVWDKETAYCWMLGADTELRKSGAVQLLLWHSIQEASKIVKRYNFEGSMLLHIEPVFRAFGAERKPVFQIRKFGNRLIEAAWVLFQSRIG